MAQLSRRKFFSDFVRSAVANAVAPIEAIARNRTACATEPRKVDRGVWLRPPGAISERRFKEVCTRCTDCVDVCPYDAIRRLGPEFGGDAGTPAIIPTESPCYLCPDMPCIAACEPKALVPVARAEVSMGTAIMVEALCYVAKGQPCDYCVSRCPLKGVAISFGDGGMPVIDPAGCVGCGVCAYLCPADAIGIVRTKD